MAAQGPPHQPPPGGPPDPEEGGQPQQPSPQGYPPQGWPPQQYPPPQQPPQGYPPQGYPPPQYPAPGGYPQQGPPGGPPPGYPPPGYPPPGYPPPGYDQRPLASVGARIGGALIDVVILAVVFVLMAAATGGVDTTNGFEASMSGLPFLLNFVLNIAYYTVFEGTMGATPGKLVAGTRVVNEQHRQVGFGPAFIRNILRPIDYFLCFLNGLIMVAATQRRQRLGDMAGNTLVLRKEYVRG